jgi:hypothetical protein
MHRFIIAITALCILALAMPVLAAPTAPKDMILGPPAAMKASKDPVRFSHARHDAAKVECVTCHHTWDAAGEIQSCAASGCHDQPGKKGATAFYSAFHAKSAANSCLGCHKAEAKNGRPVPVSCKDCHTK